MVIDLKEKSGLGLKLDADRPELVFDKDLEFSQPAIRTIDQMKEVLLDKNIHNPRELYYMYRDIHRFSDQSILEEYKLRYDVTVIKPFCLGEEFMKTAGHYHSGDFGELYEVVYGRCFCLLQRPSSGDWRVIEEVIFVEAVAGQKIVIPPGFGHILINPGPDYLVTSNWVSRGFESRYELYKKAGGAAYFVVSEAELLPTSIQPQGCLRGLRAVPSGVTAEQKRRIGIKFIKNTHFKEVANISFVQPAKQIKRFGLIEGSPIYNLINNPKALDFLNHPLDYEYKDVFVK